MEKKRLWLDTTIAAMLRKEQLEQLIAEGNLIVIANTAVDVALFQENLDWFEELLVTGKIVIEVWSTPDEMTRKSFFWSSCSLETAPADSFEEAIKNLPNSKEIMAVAELVLLHGIKRGDWPMGQWAPPAPLSPVTAVLLNLTDSATRTEILSACKAINRMDLFDDYNLGYNRGLATQHLCDGIINSDGGVTSI